MALSAEKINYLLHGATLMHRIMLRNRRDRLIYDTKEEDGKFVGLVVDPYSGGIYGRILSESDPKDNLDEALQEAKDIVEAACQWMNAQEAIL